MPNCCGVGDGERQDVELRLGEQFDGPAEGAGLVFQEQRELFDFHSGLSSGYIFRWSMTRLALPSLR